MADEVESWHARLFSSIHCRSVTVVRVAYTNSCGSAPTFECPLRTLAGEIAPLNTALFDANPDVDGAGCPYPCVFQVAEAITTSDQQPVLWNL